MRMQYIYKDYKLDGFLCINFNTFLKHSSNVSLLVHSMFGIFISFCNEEYVFRGHYILISKTFCITYCIYSLEILNYCCILLLMQCLNKDYKLYGFLWANFNSFLEHSGNVLSLVHSIFDILILFCDKECTFRALFIWIRNFLDYAFFG